MLKLMKYPGANGKGIKLITTFNILDGGLNLKLSTRTPIVLIPNCRTKLDPKARMKKPTIVTNLKILALLDFRFDSEKTRLNLSPTIIKRLIARIVIRKEDIRHVRKVKKFCVMINKIIGNENVITIIGALRLRIKVANPNFFKSFRDMGKVCNHLKEEPDIRLLVVNKPNRKR